MIVEDKKDMNRILTELIQALGSIIEEKDLFMKGHAQRVASNCVQFTRQLNFTHGQIEKVFFAGLLHDIAMVYIPLEIMQKPEKLTRDEMKVVRQHPVIAEKILANISVFKRVLPIVRHHDEAFDGSGYPDGLKGDEIPVEARVLSLADSYDAMTSARSHRSALSMEEALGEIAVKAGRQFDACLADDFANFIEVTSRLSGGNGKKQGKAGARQLVLSILKRYEKGEIELPVLPKTLHEIQRVISRPTSSADDLAKVVERDAVISLRLISVANSPLYRGTENVTAVRTAIPRLGLTETQNLVSAIAIKSLYEPKNDQFKMLMQRLWLHSLACAHAGKAIAAKLKLGQPENIFLKGLVHDLGKAPIIKSLSEFYAREESLNMDDLLSAVQEVHSRFGGLILRRWGFEKDFVRVAKWHENPKMDETTDKVVLVIHLANLLSHKIGYGVFKDSKIEPSETESSRRLGIEPDTLYMIGEEIRKIMQDPAFAF